MFKRWLLILAAFLAAAALAAPAVIGVGLERAHPWLLRRLEIRLGQIDIDVRSYQRGFFSSRMDLRVTPAGGVPLTMAVDLHQGPWTGAPEWLSADWTLVHPALEEIASGRAGVGWLGGLSGHARWSTPQAEGALEARSRLGGDSATLDLDALRLALPAVQLAGAAGAFSVTGLRQRQPRLTGRVQAGELRTPGLTASTALLELTATSRGRSVEVAVQVAGDAVALGSERFADLDLALVAQRLHRPTLDALLRTVRLRARAGLRGEALASQLRSDLLLAIPGLLANQPGLTLSHLRAVSGDGGVTAEGAIGLERAPAPGFLADPSRLLAVLRLSLDLRLPRPLLERTVSAWVASQGAVGPLAQQEATDDWMARLRANRIIVAEQGDYHATVRYRDNQLVLNGQPMMLPSF